MKRVKGAEPLTDMSGNYTSTFTKRRPYGTKIGTIGTIGTKSGQNRDNRDQIGTRSGQSGQIGSKSGQSGQIGTKSGHHVGTIGRNRENRDSMRRFVPICPDFVPIHGNNRENRDPKRRLVPICPDLSRFCSRLSRLSRFSGLGRRWPLPPADTSAPI